MITDRTKNLSLSKLQKLKEVILKILNKLNPNISKQLQEKADAQPSNLIKLLCRDPPVNKNEATITQEVESEEKDLQAFQVARDKSSKLTVTSTSPIPLPSEPVKHTPIVMSTEQVRRQLNPDLYGQVEELSNSTCGKEVFHRLGAKVDMSKPPLSEEDLESLTLSKAEAIVPSSSYASKPKSVDQRTLNDKKRTDKKDDKHSKSDSKCNRDTNKTSKPENKSQVDKTKEKDDKKEHKEEKRWRRDKTEKKKDEKKTYRGDKREQKEHKKEKPRGEKDINKEEKKDHEDKKKRHKDDKKVNSKEKESDKCKSNSKADDKAKPEKKVEDCKDLSSEIKKANSVLTHNQSKKVENIKARDPRLASKNYQRADIPSTTEVISAPNPTQIPFPLNNIGLQQNDHHQFIAPNHRSGNTHMNESALQNYVNFGVPSYWPFSNGPQDNFHNQITPSKAFYPYDPVNSNKYDLSKTQSTDIYSPNPTLLSTPGYANHSAYGGHPSREQQPPSNNPLPIENQTEWRGRFQSRWQDNNQPWESKNQWQNKNAPWEREDYYRPMRGSRYRRIRGRGMKGKSYSYSNIIDRVRSQRRSTDTYSTQNKYDSNMDRAKKIFTSPLDGLYSVTEGKPIATGKGCGVQNSEIPKKKTEASDRESDADTDVRKQVNTSEEVRKNRSGDLIAPVAQGESGNAADKTAQLQSEPSKSLSVEENILHSTESNKDQTEKANDNRASDNELETFEPQKCFSTVWNTLKGKQQMKIIKHLLKFAGSSDSEEEDEEKMIEKTNNQEETLACGNQAEVLKEEKSNESSKPLEDTTVKEKPRGEPAVVEEDTGSKIVKLDAGTKRKRASKTKKNIKKQQKLKKTVNLKRPIKSKPLEVEDVETVGERVKRRRRNIKPEIPKQRKRKTELDLLHEDIKEMFICDGVLTATRKRMCPMLKANKENDPQKTKPVLTSDQEVTKPSTSKSETILPSAPTLNIKSAVQKGIVKRNKRRQRWASDVIIKEKKRKPNSNSVIPDPPALEEEQLSYNTSQTNEDSNGDVPQKSNEIVLIENKNENIQPDVNYYLDPLEKSRCKVCSFGGKSIVQHYKLAHPSCEVLISRISPDNSKKAIDESVEKNYEDVVIPEASETEVQRRKFTYQCRFCEIFLKSETSEFFFDHLTSHTGEYRFLCNLCPFKTSNSKSLRFHFQRSHNGQTCPIQPAYPAPPNLHLVFGHMCGECNFIQMNKSAIEKHIAHYHANGDGKIYRTNMSTVDVAKPLEAPETSEVDDSQKHTGAAEEEEDNNNHLLNMRKNDLTVKVTEMRRLSDDKFSEVSSEHIQTDNEDNVLSTENGEDCLCKITNVVSLADENSEVPPLTLVNNAIGSGSIVKYSNPVTTAPLYPISTQPSTSGYNLLSPVNQPSTEASPILTTTRRVRAIKISPKKLITLKETPLQPEELTKPRKSQAALDAFLAENSLIHLYKCPEYHCKFSTNTKTLFDSHLSQHKIFKRGMQIPCLYCDFRTDFEYFSVHCDIRHGRCRYCCVYCFYRAINQSYVEIHQEREHFGKARHVLIIEISPDALLSQCPILKPALKTIIPPYRCGQLGCTRMFFFPGEFKDHLKTTHNNIPLMCFVCRKTSAHPDKAIIHMAKHNIHMYHCRYCEFGGESSDEIYKHLAHQHFALKPRIICRLLDTSTSMTSHTNNNVDDPNELGRLSLITVENPRYISKHVLYSVRPWQERIEDLVMTPETREDVGNIITILSDDDDDDDDDDADDDVEIVCDEVVSLPNPNILRTSEAEIKASTVSPLSTYNKVNL